MAQPVQGLQMVTLDTDSSALSTLPGDTSAAQCAPQTSPTQAAFKRDQEQWATHLEASSLLSGGRVHKLHLLLTMKTPGPYEADMSQDTSVGGSLASLRPGWQ